MKRIVAIVVVSVFSAAAFAQTTQPGRKSIPLFPDEGVPKGWVVQDWSDVGKAPPEGAVWKVEDGILHGSTPRGTWLVSEKLYGDFILELDFKLGEAGNSGVGMRFPDAGDPAFDGLELQIVDRRYYGNAAVELDELTGSLYKAIPPRQQVYMPTEWNHYRITCQGPRVRVELNGFIIIDTNLDDHARPLERGTPMKDRPRKGHLGFQELSRGGGHVMIRKARITELE